jgi:hypothetical protein
MPYLPIHGYFMHWHTTGIIYFVVYRSEPGREQKRCFVPVLFKRMESIFQSDVETAIQQNMIRSCIIQYLTIAL